MTPGPPRLWNPLAAAGAGDEGKSYELQVKGFHAVQLSDGNEAVFDPATGRYEPMVLEE